MASVVARQTRRHTAELLRDTKTALAKGKFPEGERDHLLLLDLPRTALPADIRRLCAKKGADHVAKVSLDYYRFSPTGRAWLTLTNPKFSNPTLKSLDKSPIAGAMLRAHLVSPQVQRPSRSRGVRGRTEAAERGLIAGMGPDGGIPHAGQCVVMYGLPGKLSAENLHDYLKSYRLAGTEDGQKEIVKLEVYDPKIEKFALTSRHLVRLASVSEAHRLVRNLHMSYFRPEANGTRYHIHARVLY